MAKVTMIGAGSVVFARNLLVDLLSYPELVDCTVTLMDINKSRLELIAALAEKMVAERGLPTRIEATLDRQQALDGADYVITMIQVGGLDAFELDVSIPRRYGIDQTVGDTLGPGGVFRALRTIPVLVEIAHDMERLCPHALLINYANPMAMNCWALATATKVKAVGLCHSVQGTAALLAEFMEVPFEQLTYWCAGINHMAWYLKLEHEGKDVYPLLWKAMDDPAKYSREQVRFEVMRHFGYFVTESSHHMSEYVPYFRKNAAMVNQYVPKRWDYLEVCKNGWQPHYEEVRKQIAGEAPVRWRRSDEYGIRIVRAMETNEPVRINGNVTNTGLITNLPQGSCVEVPCLVDSGGIHPCHVGDLPAQLAALNRSNIAVQELAVRAALTGDREAVRMAIALDPLTSALLTLEQTRQLTDEMLAAESQYLPQFD
jgi:alpha-galactosidase